MKPPYKLFEYNSDIFKGEKVSLSAIPEQLPNEDILRNQAKNLLQENDLYKAVCSLFNKERPDPNKYNFWNPRFSLFKKSAYTFSRLAPEPKSMEMTANIFQKEKN